jgi:hypothetical protein
MYTSTHMVLGHIGMGCLWILDQNGMTNIAYEPEARIACNKILNGRFITSQ